MAFAAKLRARLGVLSLQDWVFCGFMAIVATLVGVSAPPGGPGPVVYPIVAFLVVLPGSAWLARRAKRVPAVLRLNLYRVVYVAAAPACYLIVHAVLQALRPESMDHVLAAWDQSLFGGQPVLWAEALNRRPIVEWLSFFYFNHHFLVFGTAIGAVWIARKTPRAAAELGIGIALLYGIGHLGYLAVPAQGPYQFLAERFQAPVDGGTFWQLVWNGVVASGAPRDVFPSMHSGASALCAFFAVHQALGDRRWRIPAVLACFLSLNIVVATLVLRWHYAVDVVVGLSLSFGAAFAATRLGPWETARRARLGLPPVWPLA
ncbi:MAG: phosphatase PAP2 family protein [Myxococcales bacterium]|nr:phosphatase PAP2 family protein [Myxococcales bacterium]